MMKQTPSPVKRLWELAGAHRRAYAFSIFLAILGVACGMIPYFAIAYIMLCLMDGVTALSTYALWCGVILLGFTLKLPQHMPEAFVCNCDLAAGMLIQELEKQGYRP